MSTQKGKANTIKKTFSRETSIHIDIAVDCSTLWAILINASDFSRWNSTIVSLEGDIKVGNTLQLKSTLDEKRVFKLKVKEMISDKKLVWGDSMGNRTYLLTKNETGGCRFSMVEKIGGLMFPLFAGFIPSFDASFEQFAADLKKEAEKIIP